MGGFLIYIFSLLFLQSDVVSIQILSKSKLEKCVKSTDSHHELNCTIKIVINMAVPSGSSSDDASIVAEIVEAEENSTNKMQTLRIPPVLTTHKCQPDVGVNVLKICERQVTLFIFRVPSSCGNIFDKLVKRKANTVHCLRFPGTILHSEARHFISIFKLYPTTDQAAKYFCSAVLKDSEFNKVDKAECQFSTTATTFDNGSQITPFQPLKASISGCLEYLE
ncbi:hypothetical protein J1N35_027426 [Gossypium stocksii]|uniref:Generative cell specific-1/HAP2 domain-containing protein n=1 Tax=Gossypium stocksii TaxID=47602 RepID=A0A9D3VBE5_9ROSI|nr:hypothetical protein J1N35_027426 [Gossypium stocksii]